MLGRAMPSGAAAGRWSCQCLSTTKQESLLSSSCIHVWLIHSGRHVVLGRMQQRHPSHPVSHRQLPLDTDLTSLQKLCKLACSKRVTNRRSQHDRRTAHISVLSRHRPWHNLHLTQAPSVMQDSHGKRSPIWAHLSSSSVQPIAQVPAGESQPEQLTWRPQLPRIQSGDMLDDDEQLSPPGSEQAASPSTLAAIKEQQQLPHPDIIHREQPSRKEEQQSIFDSQQVCAAAIAC